MSGFSYTTSVKMIKQKPYLDCNSFTWGEDFIAVRIVNVCVSLTCHKNYRKLRAKLHVLNVNMYNIYYIQLYVVYIIYSYK